MSDIEEVWLAGLWEGEGTFSIAYDKSRDRKTYMAKIKMTDKDVMEYVASLLNKWYPCVDNNAKRKQQQEKEIKVNGPYRGEAHHKDSYVVVLYGRRARLLANQLRPHLFSRRQAQIKVFLGE
jgi:hypothetical protein